MIRFGLLVFVSSLLVSFNVFAASSEWSCVKADKEVSVTGKNAEEKKADCETQGGTWTEKKQAQSSGSGGGW